MARFSPEIDFEILWKKIHGSLSGEENRLFESWIIEDRRHLDYFKNVERFYKEGSGFDQKPPPPEVSWNKFLKRLRHAGKRRRQRRVAILAPAAALLIILASLLFLNRPEEAAEVTRVAPLPGVMAPGTHKARLILDDGSAYDLSGQQELNLRSAGTSIRSQGTSLAYLPVEPGPAALKYNILTVPRGGEFFLTLADGTGVWLNSGTTLRYPVQFASGKREVELDGEAYFEVASDVQKPFQIITGEQVVEVTGTSLNISSYADEEMISTTLVTGRVHVFLASDPAVSENLWPSHQSVFNKASKSLSQAKVNVDEHIAWKEGWFRFEDQDLSGMMKTLSRWYDVNVTFQDKSAMDIKFTGSIRRYENFEEILEIIERTREVHFEISGTTILIWQEDAD